MAWRRTSDIARDLREALTRAAGTVCQVTRSGRRREIPWAHGTLPFFLIASSTLLLSGVCVGIGMD